MDELEKLTRAPRLSLLEFQELQRIFNSAAGLSFDDSAMPLFQRRLASRLPLHDLHSYREYARLLQRGAQSSAELTAALDLVTSGETYFFRHGEQLALLGRTIFPALASANASSRRLNVWSAGCSSGEEAYTVAILLAESGLFSGWSIRIIGTDLSHERVELARQGCYFQGAFRSTDERIRRQWFVEVGRVFQVCDELRAVCQFAPQNLLSRQLDPFVGRMDLILCRNVLIYLDDRARTRVVENLYERLMPGGYLLLGHSESLKQMSQRVELQSLASDLAFRKPARVTRRGSDT